MTTDPRPSLRRDHPALWAEIVRIARQDGVADWTEDEIAHLIAKVRAPDPDKLIEALGHVICWAGAAMRSDDEDAQATVSLWVMDGPPIEIHVGEDGAVYHRIDPDVAVEFVR